ncbi:MAG: cytochrome c biogenesis protein CcsA [Verrucomicrobia bacterium]|nr:cytochrome c biogenesis protein CcsA [Verrucomicrobiota bacterium]
MIKKAAPWIFVLLVAGWLASKMMPEKPAPQGFNFVEFGKLPVLVGGRVMPMDSVARISLSLMNHHGAYEPVPHKPVPPVAWLVNVMMRPEEADQARVFEIVNPELLDLLGGSDRQDKLFAFNLFSFNEFKPFLSEIEKQAQAAEQTDAQTRNAFQREIIKLRNALLLYLRLKNSLQPEGSPDFKEEIDAFAQAVPTGMQAIQDRDAGKPFDQAAFERILQFTQRYQNLAQARYVYAFPDPAAPDATGRWQHVGEALLGTIRTRRVEPAVGFYATLISAYRQGDAAGFNAAVSNYQNYLRRTVPGELNRPDLEAWFNHAAPFLQAMVLYVLVFICAVLSWLFWPRTLARVAGWLLLLAFVLHTGGLITRMYLQGRPPVTNLYSSAIFVGWGAVLLCLFLERIYRNGIGNVCAATAGFVTLLIAYNLQLDGDTLEMLRAVLDTNVWLATHVVVVALGYSSTFLAGLLGVIYVIRRLFVRSFTPELSRSLGRMIYGIVCFATLFSLVGTILGGIWADQSWGRFWGWDPKENGALLIVLWNAIILHARWGGYVKERGIALMAVFGNIITSLSWFGTNMLGVGLHSYGFMDQAFNVLIGFIAGQLVLIGIGLLPVASRGPKRPVAPLEQAGQLTK